MFNPFSGKPLHYKLDSAGPVIYSVGPNGKDEGGMPRAPVSEGDLVWRYRLPEGFSFDEYLVY